MCTLMYCVVMAGSADKLFECHIRLEAAAKATFSKEAAKIGGHDLYVMRECRLPPFVR